ncbi:hypothetical protein CGC20_33850 [Leishmania donovani]|uniref:Uncharacterized protein n=1 Tax=Leishmania donovani TaxID=5661 RepID=A0A504XHE2_LEIDO|nr:hypothetical protein CGC20_33850 [Leishmania donovani]
MCRLQATAPAKALKQKWNCETQDFTVTRGVPQYGAETLPHRALAHTVVPFGARSSCPRHLRRISPRGHTEETPHPSHACASAWAAVPPPPLQESRVRTRARAQLGEHGRPSPRQRSSPVRWRRRRPLSGMAHFASLSASALRFPRTMANDALK